MIKYIKSHWRRFLTLLLFIIFFIIIFNKFSEIEPVENKEQIIVICGITLQNWGTILAICGTVYTLIWGMFEYDKRRIISQQQKASEIADEFSKDIVEKLAMISSTLLGNKKFSTKLKKIDANKLKRFDRFELEEILDYEESKKTEVFISEILEIIHSESTQNEYRKKLENWYGEDEMKKFPKKFSLLVQLTLNRLEFLCMNISSNVAGSQFIYQSLHQVFLQTIHILSVEICSKNHNNVDKYYTNVIEVYNMWNKEKIKNIKKLEKTTAKIEKLRNKSQKEIEKLLHIKSKTV